MRKAKGWDQVTFARRLHTSQPAVSQWELDKWLPKPFMRKRIAEELGVAQSFLFGDETTSRAA